MLFKVVVAFAATLIFQVQASDIGEKRVFGRHLRTQVTNTTSFPFRSVGQIGNFCTGTLIGSKFVLTAAHCVVDLREGRWIPGTDFAPGRNAKKNPLGITKWKRIIVPKEYVEENDRASDYALIVLNDDIGKKHGTIALANPQDIDDNVSSNIVGYPGDKPQGTMWKVFCPVTINSDRETVRHLCDTFGGMSGSAIYSYNSSSKKRSIIGVHTYGTHNHNGGVFLNKDKIARLKDWMRNPFASYPIARTNPAL